MRGVVPYLLTMLVTGGSACARTKLPPPEMQGGCEGVADVLECSDGDSKTEDPTKDPSEPFEPETPEPIEPFELACDEEGNLRGSGPFEILVSGDDFASLAVAPDGTVFATATIDGTSQQAFRLVDGEIEPFGDELWGVGQLIVDGSDLIASAPVDNVAPAILMIDLKNQEQRMVARMAGYVSQLAVDRDAVYWTRGVQARINSEVYREQLWRAPRRSGESVLLAEIDGSNFGDLVALGDDLYFFSTEYDEGSGDVTLQRIATDGSGSVSSVLQLRGYASSLRTDGEDLFFTAVENPDEIDPRSHITRADGATLETQTLFDIDGWADVLIAHGGYAYWATYTDEKLELWRGSADGRGDPQRLGTSETMSVDSFTGHATDLYWIASCWRDDLSSAKSNILKMSL